jgi:hypothetical protein
MYNNPDVINRNDFGTNESQGLDLRDFAIFSKLMGRKEYLTNVNKKSLIKFNPSSYEEIRMVFRGMEKRRKDVL